MRILQIIDSLEAGGAERMAVNYANALSERIEFSGLVATRAEGSLKEKISNTVYYYYYYYLCRKKTIDINAVLRLKRYCRQHNVNYVQAHSSSFFIAVLLKMVSPKIKIIWHNHNGASEFISKKDLYSLKMASCFFDGIIVVNDRLKIWVEKNLFCKKTIYLPNFTVTDSVKPVTQLQGNIGKRILCLANLREVKNHFFLLQVAENVRKIYPDWTFHLVGKDFEDGYSQQIKEIIAEKKLSENVFIYGTKNDVTHIISQSDIAVLTSKSEGLPVSLIEYGLLKKPVVVTKVGEIPSIVEDGVNGYTTDPDDVDLFCQKLEKLISDENLREVFSNAFYRTISENHAEAGVISKYLNWVK